MPKTRQQKEELLQQLIDDLSSAKAAALTSFTKITVSADQELRNELRQHEVKYGVVKKTLLRKAFEKLGLPTNKVDEWQGNISLAVSEKDEVTPAKLIDKFIKDNENMVILGGMLGQEWMDVDRVRSLAKLPFKEELIAKTVDTIKAPLNGLVNVLAGNLKGLVNVLNTIKDQKA